MGTNANYKVELPSAHLQNAVAAGTDPSIIPLLRRLQAFCTCESGLRLIGMTAFCELERRLRFRIGTQVATVNLSKNDLSVSLTDAG